MRSLLPKSIFVLVQPTSLKQANLESMKRMYLGFGILLEEGFRFGALLESSLFQFILDMKQLKSSWKGDTQLTLTFCEKKAFQYFLINIEKYSSSSWSYRILQNYHSGLHIKSYYSILPSSLQICNSHPAT